MSSAPRSIRVAAGQMEALPIGRSAEAWPAIERLLAEAARAGAELLVLPECAHPAYYLESPERYRAADVLPSGAVLERLGRLAAAARLHLCCGLAEEREGRLFNSAALFDPAGRLIGVARKSFLWDCDHRWFTPGKAIRVFETALGRVGVMICADARVPEIAATLARRGAQLVAMPTAWVNTGRDAATVYNIQPDFLIEARAREFGLPFVCADKSGPEPPLHYVGQSLVAGAAGQVLIRAPVEGEALVTAELTLGSSRPARLTAAQRERLAWPAARVHATNVAAQPATLAIDPGGFQTGPARAARIEGAEAASFAAARCHALDGAQVLCVRDAPADRATLRARAAENRMYLLADGAAGRMVIDPVGAVRKETAPNHPLSVQVDLAEADRKQFTPETDLWAGRRVEQYEF